MNRPPNVDDRAPNQETAHAPINISAPPRDPSSIHPGTPAPRHSPLRPESVPLKNKKSDDRTRILPPESPLRIVSTDKCNPPTATICDTFVKQPIQNLLLRVP